MVIFQSYVKLPEGIIPFKLKGHQFFFSSQISDFSLQAWAYVKDCVVEGSPLEELRDPSAGESCRGIHGIFLPDDFVQMIFVYPWRYLIFFKKISNFHLKDSYDSHHQMINPLTFRFFSPIEMIRPVKDLAALAPNEHNTLGQAKMLAQTAIVPCVPLGNPERLEQLAGKCWWNRPLGNWSLPICRVPLAKTVRKEKPKTTQQLCKRAYVIMSIDSHLCHSMSICSNLSGSEWRVYRFQESS